MVVPAQQFRELKFTDDAVTGFTPKPWVQRGDDWVNEAMTEVVDPETGETELVPVITTGPTYRIDLRRCPCDTCGHANMEDCNAAGCQCCSEACT